MLNPAVGCSGPEPQASTTTPQPETATQKEVPIGTFKVKNAYPHDPKSFTQGLLFLDSKTLWESSGLYGQSTLRKVDLETGKVLQRVNVPVDYFAEGMTEFKGKLYQLTWEHHKGFIYDPATMKKTGEFAYTGEGWGLTHDDKYLILSDGTSDIRFLNPETFEVEKIIVVKNGNNPVDQLNELEYINGEIWANVWQTDWVVRIDPETGTIKSLVNFTGLLRESERREDTDVLNGIAYDAKTKKLLITGKKWPKIFEVEVVLPSKTDK